MGAKIEIRNNTSKYTGPCFLTGAEVMATDLRASVSLSFSCFNCRKRELK